MKAGGLVVNFAVGTPPLDSVVCQFIVFNILWFCRQWQNLYFRQVLMEQGNVVPCEWSLVIQMILKANPDPGEQMRMVFGIHV